MFQFLCFFIPLMPRLFTYRHLRSCMMTVVCRFLRYTKFFACFHVGLEESFSLFLSPHATTLQACIVPRSNLLYHQETPTHLRCTNGVGPSLSKSICSPDYEHMSSVTYIFHIDKIYLSWNGVILISLNNWTPFLRYNLEKGGDVNRVSQKRVE